MLEGKYRQLAHSLGLATNSELGIWKLKAPVWHINMHFVGISTII